MSTHAPPEASPEKENSQGPSKRMRKSLPVDARRKSVSFGMVSKVYYEKEEHAKPSPLATLTASPGPSSSADAPPAAAAAAAAPPPTTTTTATRPAAAEPPQQSLPPPSAPQPQPPAAQASNAAASSPRRSPRNAAASSSPRRSPRIEAKKAVPASPSASEASDVFFSPVESFHSAMDGGGEGTPRGMGTPSLAGLLDEDEQADAAPALSQLLAQDLSREATTTTAAPAATLAPAEEDATETMDMTIAIGGILSGAAAPEAPPAFGSDDADDTNQSMDMTTAVGGILKGVALQAPPGLAPPAFSPAINLAAASPAPPASLSAFSPAPPSQPPSLPTSAAGASTPAWLSHAAELTSRLPSLPHESPAADPMPPPPPADQSRRKSLSNKIAEVSSRVWRSFASSGVDDPNDDDDEYAIDGATAANTAANAAAPPTGDGEVRTFDDYLNAAGVHFLDSSGAAASSRASVHKGGGLLIGYAGETSTLSEEILAATVLDAELKQLRWAGGELLKCIGVLAEGYASMEEYIALNYPGFFAAPEAQIPPADLKRLKARCRQTARALWYDWRHTLEEDSARKLTDAGAALEEDLAKMRAVQAEARAVEGAINAAMPSASVSAEAAAKAAASREAANALAFQQTAVARAESSQFALNQQLLAAESDLVKARESHRAQATRLIELERAHAAQQRHQQAAGESPVLTGDALLDAVHTAVSWQPLSLTSSAITLGFGSPVAFELRASLMPAHAAHAPDGHTIHHVDLLSRGSTSHHASGLTAAGLTPGGPSDSSNASPSAVLKECLFGRAHSDLRAQIDTCRSGPAWNALVAATSLQLGRILELCAEVDHIALRVPTSAHVLPDGSGVSVSIMYSFFAMRTRLTLHLRIAAADPTQPLGWQIQLESATAPPPPPSNAPASTCTALVSAEPLRPRIAEIVDAHAKGFGRLRAIHAELTQAFAAP